MDNLFLITDIMLIQDFVVDPNLLLGIMILLPGNLNFNSTYKLISFA